MSFISGANFFFLRPTAPVVIACGLALSGCTDGEDFNFLNKSAAQETAAPTAGQTTKLVERDVEAPEVFSTSEAGLWDGRPSLGGVWAAHPDVGEPERVIIRNLSLIHI